MARPRPSGQNEVVEPSVGHRRMAIIDAGIYDTDDDPPAAGAGPAVGRLAHAVRQPQEPRSPSGLVVGDCVGECADQPGLSGDLLELALGQPRREAGEDSLVGPEQPQPSEGITRKIVNSDLFSYMHECNLFMSDYI